MPRPTSRVSGVVMTGPLAAYQAAYVAELRRLGYTSRSAVNESRQVARLSVWMDHSGLTAAELSGGRIEEFLSYQRGTGRFRAQWSRAGLRCLQDVLRDLAVVGDEPQSQASPREALLGRFERYELAERGLAAGTVRGYVAHAGRFLDGLGQIALADVTAAEVIAAVLRESAAVSVSATQNFVAGLRAFLRFCFIEGCVPGDLSQAALPVTGRRRSSLPRGISKADAKSLLASCDRRFAIGRRDYAVLVTLLRLGLRRGEVAALRLEDIDWRNGELVVRGKGSRLDRLPL
ncbi:MAG TPA: tyrosine-type recombinase/integrase, partial [Actinomycetota bacterium]|nr:tyrosine-type recombinase/integrase [Actinomycetota bacterium]